MSLSEASCCICWNSCADKRAKWLEGGVFAAHCTCLANHWYTQVASMVDPDRITMLVDDNDTKQAFHFAQSDFAGVISADEIAKARLSFTQGKASLTTPTPARSTSAPSTSPVGRSNPRPQTPEGTTAGRSSTSNLLLWVAVILAIFATQPQVQQLYAEVQPALQQKMGQPSSLPAGAPAAGPVPWQAPSPRPATPPQPATSSEEPASAAHEPPASAEKTDSKMESVQAKIAKAQEAVAKLKARKSP